MFINLLKREFKLALILNFRCGKCLTEFLIISLLLQIAEDDSIDNNDDDILKKVLDCYKKRHTPIYSM